MLRLLLILALLAIALVAQAPAWLVAERVGAATGDVVQLRNASGTWWKGSGEAVIPLAAPGAVASLGVVRWRVGRVDAGAKSVTVSVEEDHGGPQPIIATLGRGSATAAGSVRVPASILWRLPQAAGWTATGAIIAVTDRIDWDGARPTGILNLRWPNAGLAPPGSPEPIALGEVAGRAQFGPAGPAVTVANTGGSLKVEGALDPRSGQATLTVQPRPDTPPQLTAWLQSRLGPPPPGGYALAYSLPRR